MSTITFDKLAYIDTLKASGIDEAQARAQAMALDIALKDTVATKHDLAAIDYKIGLVQAELAMVKWMVGGTFFAISMLVVKSFWSG